MDALNIVFGIATLVSAYIAIREGRSKRRLQKLLRIESWEMYSNAGLLLGYTQQSISKIHEQKIDEARQLAGSSEAMAQAIFNHSIRNISHLYDFDTKLVEKWVRERKMVDHHKDAFLRFCDAP